MNENCSNTKDFNVFVSFVWSLIFKKTHRIFLNYILKKINNSLNLDFKKNYNRVLSIKKVISIKVTFIDKTEFYR